MFIKLNAVLLVLVLPVASEVVSDRPVVRKIHKAVAAYAKYKRLDGNGGVALQPLEGRADASADLQEQNVKPKKAPVLDTSSPCVGDVIDKFKAEFPRQPRIALIIAEKINRLPMRPTVRMDRFASALQGSDVFVAIDPEDLEYVHLLKPVPLKVGLFNRTWPDTFTKKQEGSKLGGGLLQLLRTNDAFNLIRQQEVEQGWKYDVVARLRLESTQSDICTMGLNKGCMAPGAWSDAIAAHVLQGKERSIWHSHDRAFLGRRDDMEELFRFYMKSVDGKGLVATMTHFGASTCEDGKLAGVANIKSVCRQSVNMKLYDDSKGLRVGDMLFQDCSSGSFQLCVMTRHGFKEVGPGPLKGYEIRRFAYDYPHENNHDTQINPNDHRGYASGCAPYPVVGDRQF
jgi:hypothetical protein